MSLDALSRDERLRLLKFVCFFAWADLEVAPPEREAAARLLRRLELGEEEARSLAEWLRVPPPAEDLDPTDVPAAHRQVFLDEVRRMVAADGRVAEGEREALCLFERLLERP